MVNDTKIFESPTYGDTVWRYIGTMSAKTFDAFNKEEFDAWEAAHPKANFGSFSNERTDDYGIFKVWLPLKRDNLDWEYTGRTVIYQKLKKGQLPWAIADKEVIKWFKKAEQFMIEVNDELIDAIYDDVEKETQIKEATKTQQVQKPITTKQYPAKKGSK